MHLWAESRAQKKKQDLRVPHAGEDGPLFRPPKTCFTGIELFRGENIPYFVCAKLFFSADFAPLVLKSALEVHYGQLWGGFWRTRTPWIELQIA